MTNIFEHIRAYHEDMEDMEQAASDCLRAKSRRELAVSADHCVDFLSREMQMKAKELVAFYDDQEGLRCDELSLISGEGSSDVWRVYYNRITLAKDVQKRSDNKQV